MSLFSALGNWIGGGQAKKAATQSAAAQTAAIQKGIDTVGAQNTWTQQQLSPFITPGQQATSAIAQLLGLGATPPPGAAAVAPLNWNAAEDYVNNNEDLVSLFAAQTGQAKGKTKEQFGQEHWARYGSQEAANGQRAYGMQSGPPQQEAAAPVAGGPSAADQQASAIAALKGSPLFQSLFNTGEEAILANSAATGGLRGGNTQRGLADFGSDTLAKVIQQQLANLGGLSSQGLNAATTGGQIGANAAGSIANLFGSQGQAQAQGIMGRAAGTAAQTGAIFQGIGDIASAFMPVPGGGGGGGISSSIGKALF